MAVGVRTQTIALPKFDRRRVIGILLAAIAGLLVLVMTRPESQVPILVASGDIVAGQPLGAQQVAVRYVTDAEGLVAGTDVGELSDWSLRAPLSDGEPLIPSLLQPPELIAFPNVIALSLDQEHAVLGHLVAGDRVDVYRTTSVGFDVTPVTERVATGVYVVEVRMSEAGINADRVDLLLAVDEELAALLAGAVRSGEIDLVRVAP